MQPHQCRGCDADDVVRVVDLGSHPAADYFPPAETPEPDPRWPLELWLCRSCTLVAGVADPDRLAALHAVAHRSATALHDYLVDQKNRGQTVLGYGAPSKAPVLLDISRVGPDLLQFTVDAAPGKHGRRIPGCGVPIRPVDDLRAARPDVVPLPEPHLVTR